MILTPRQMAQAEKFSENNGVSLAQLMSNAGYALSREVKKAAYRLMKKNVLILCGKGNNGGDGFVCANHLLSDGLCVSVALVCSEPETDLAVNAFDALEKDVKIIKNDLDEAIGQADIIIDAVFGTGFRGELPEDIRGIFDLVNRSEALKIACDMPSGVNSLTGQTAFGTIRCDLTVTFHAIKIGCLSKPAVNFCGKISVCDIKISQEQENYCDYKIIEADEDHIKKALPKRDICGHKGSFGKLLAVCGSESYKGAAVLSVGSALRSGVGLVELFGVRSVCEAVLNSYPEAICTNTASEAPEAAAEAILEKSKKATAILIGCGISDSENSRILVEKIIENSEIPVIIDADGINSVSKNINVLSNAKAPIILTPHPAELARLCKAELPEVLSDRLGYAVNLAKRFNVTVMAKGAGTFITDGKQVVFSNTGNTALSKGGSGDILAGMTASFIAQGADSVGAAAAASFLLGKTAEILAETVSERGIIGSDIISTLPYAFKKYGV